MYEAYWPIALLIYYVVVFVVAFAWRSLLVYRRSGINPLLGLFLIFPSAVTAALLVAGEILMQVQVRLEEQHLANMHGAAYGAYRAKVRRWL